MTLLTARIDKKYFPTHFSSFVFALFKTSKILTDDSSVTFLTGHAKDVWSPSLLKKHIKLPDSDFDE